MVADCGDDGGDSADEALSGDGNKEQTAKADAVEFLSSVLANGPVKAKIIEAEARAACLLRREPINWPKQAVPVGAPRAWASRRTNRKERKPAGGSGPYPSIRCPRRGQMPLKKRGHLTRRGAPDGSLGAEAPVRGGLLWLRPERACGWPTGGEMPDNLAHSPAPASNPPGLSTSRPRWQKAGS